MLINQKYSQDIEVDNKNRRFPSAISRFQKLKESEGKGGGIDTVSMSTF